MNSSYRRYLIGWVFLVSASVWAADISDQAADARENEPAGYYRNPLAVAVADPFVLLHNGAYYLYGTSAPDQGLKVWVSNDLVRWDEKGFALRKTPDTWAQNHFWGPEVIEVDGKFLMYFNASPNSSFRDRPLNMTLCIARSDSPLGPFVELKAPLYDPDPPDEAIDQNVFIDDDGQAYLYFTRVTVGRNEIQVVKLKENMIEFEGQPTLCVRSTEPWESFAWNGHLVAEGAFTFKHKGLYYLTYTADHFLDPNYSIGYATSESPLGPWEKFSGNPILKKTDHIHGPGNGMIVPSPDKTELFMVYHVHADTSKATPRRLAIDRVRLIPQPTGPDIIQIQGPTHTPQPAPPNPHPPPLQNPRPKRGPLTH